MLKIDRKHVIQAAAVCCLTFLFGIGIEHQPEKVSDIVIQPVVAGAVEIVPESAGVGLWMQELVTDTDEETLRKLLAMEGIDEETEDSEEDEYANFAIAAQITDYVNVRSEATRDSERVGKMYKGSVAQVVDIVGEGDDLWFKIISGDVEGFIKAEYFLYGKDAQDVIEDYITRYAQVNVTRLNVRMEPSVEAARIGYVDSGERIKLLENQGEWLYIQYTDEKKGYVAAEYTTIVEEFIYAISVEEEQALLAAQEALAAREADTEDNAPENITQASNAYEQILLPDGGVASNDELRSEVINYAMQFLGNRYVHGGRSLASGTDCSGFTCYVYAAFGYALSRTPSGQLSGAGRAVSFEEAKPGDIICYGKGKCTHVALYIGNNQILHSANSRKGVIIGDAHYDNILGIRNVID